MRSKAEGASMVTRETTTLTCQDSASRESQGPQPSLTYHTLASCSTIWSTATPRAVRFLHGKPPANPCQLAVSQRPPPLCRGLIPAGVVFDPRGSHLLLGNLEHFGHISQVPCRSAYLGWQTEVTPNITNRKGGELTCNQVFFLYMEEKLSRGLYLALVCLHFW